MGPGARFSEKHKKGRTRAIRKGANKDQQTAHGSAYGPGRGQNGRRNVGRERKDGQMIKWFNYSKIILATNCR